jgi:hypothetical protein
MRVNILSVCESTRPFDDAFLIVNPSQIAAQGGLQAVLCCLAAHPSSSSVWISATRLLPPLLRCNDMTHGMFVVLDGMDMLAQGLTRHVSDPIAVECGLAVLTACLPTGMRCPYTLHALMPSADVPLASACVFVLFADEETVAAALFPVVIHAMCAWPSNLQVWRHGLHFLIAMTSFAPPHALSKYPVLLLRERVWCRCLLETRYELQQQQQQQQLQEQAASTDGTGINELSINLLQQLSRLAPSEHAAAIALAGI